MSTIDEAVPAAARAAAPLRNCLRLVSLINTLPFRSVIVGEGRPAYLASRAGRRQWNQWEAVSSAVPAGPPRPPWRELQRFIDPAANPDRAQEVATRMTECGQELRRP